MLQFDVRLTMTAEDIADALKRAPLRRASKGRLIGQTVALAFVFVWCMVAFIMDDAHEVSSLFIALAALALGVVMWFAPQWQTKQIIRDTVENGKPLHLWVFENGVDFGEEPSQKPYYAFSELTWFLPDEKTRETLVWRLPSYDVIVVPKARLTDEQWHFLLSKAV